MDRERLVLQTGAAALVFALGLRLLCALPSAEWLDRQKLISFLFFAETGHRISFIPETQPAEPTAPTLSAEPAALPVFTEADASRVRVRSGWGYEADVPALLQTPLQWELSQKQPTVLILHSHATESYQNTENYTESSAFRTLDTRYNMVSIGAALKSRLEDAGIQVLHAEDLHDYPSYNGSYDQSRQTAQQYLSQHPEILLILDLHRDALEDSSGNQTGPTISVPGGDAARLMLVVGSDFGGQEHPQWQQNLALAVKLQAQLEDRYPGICRDISFRSQRFNQDLSPGAILVEVGAAGNTRQEALLAADCLAQAILDLAHGVKTEKPP